MKIMTNHTPGPWTAILNEVQDHRADVVTECCCVATCGTGNTALANARLIAAVPELLDACADMFGFITHTLPAAAWQDQPWLRPARAALAKAQGGDK